MKKIMFCDKYKQTEAVLLELKTMKRSLVPLFILYKVDQYLEEYYSGTLDTITVQEAILNMLTGERMCKAVFQIDEVLAVAQPYKDIVAAITLSFGSSHSYDNLSKKTGWHNRRYVEADLMPYQVRITNIKVERLQDISEEDAIKEGVQVFDTPDGKVYVPGGVYIGEDSRLKIAKGMINFARPFNSARDAFSFLFDKVHGKGTWERNPWVVANEFILLK